MIFYHELSTLKELSDEIHVIEEGKLVDYIGVTDPTREGDK